MPLARRYGPCPHPAVVLVVDADRGAAPVARCPQHAPPSWAVPRGLGCEPVVGTPPPCSGLWITFVLQEEQAPAWSELPLVRPPPVGEAEG